MPNKLVVILGPTSSGKSALGIKLAKQFNGEIISADSRQIYIGMDLGTGKVTKREQKLVPHHLLDIASPRSQYTASRFKKTALKSIHQITNKNKVPFIVGGTAFYIYSIIDDLKLPEVKPNRTLRKDLDKKTTPQLVALLTKLDPKRAKKIDQNNRRRLIRAIEIVKETGQPIPSMEFTYPKHKDVLILGLTQPLTTLFKLIDQRIDQRIKSGMIKEVERLHKQGLSHKKLQAFGLEYKYISKFLTGELDRSTMIAELKNASHKFAKRQMTWFKRDPRIIWIKNDAQATRHAKQFLK
jgi:tRNA dimethylallyltransferase